MAAKADGEIWIVITRTDSESYLKGIRRTHPVVVAEEVLSLAASDKGETGLSVCDNQGTGRGNYKLTSKATPS